VKNPSRKRLACLLISLLLLLSAAPITPLAQATESGTPGDLSPMQQYAQAMSPSYNLNGIDCKNPEDERYPEPTEDLIRFIADSGFKSIRIPIRWHMWGELTEPDYTINSGLLDRVRQVVDWALDAGLFVVIDNHDNRFLGDPNVPFGYIMQTRHDEYLDYTQKLWEQIAGKFKDYPNRLSFEAINEICFTKWEDYTTTQQHFDWLDEIHDVFINTVRGSGGQNATRPLLIDTYRNHYLDEYGVDAMAEYLSRLDDRNIIVTVHCYFGGMDRSLWDPAPCEEYIRGIFDNLYNKFVSRGTPVCIGEFGISSDFDGSWLECNGNQYGERLKLVEFASWYAKQKGLILALWDDGRFANLRELKWNVPEIPKLMTAAQTTRSSYADFDFIYLKKGSAAKDVAMKLHTNGNTLIAVRNGSKILTEGAEYTLDGDRIIFDGTFLQQFKTGNYGVKDTLTLQFSAGVDWKLNLIYYDTPELSELSERSWINESVYDILFASYIPIAFNGDRLMAVTSVYADGQPTGGTNDEGNLFREYLFDFFPEYDNPRYDTGRILLRSDFSEKLDQGEDVFLVFYFWSGTKIIYKMKSENNGWWPSGAVIVSGANTLLTDFNGGGILNTDEYSFANGSGGTAGISNGTLILDGNVGWGHFYAKTGQITPNGYDFVAVRAKFENGSSPDNLYVKLSDNADYPANCALSNIAQLSVPAADGYTDYFIPVNLFVRAGLFGFDYVNIEHWANGRAIIDRIWIANSAAKTATMRIDNLFASVNGEKVRVNDAQELTPIFNQGGRTMVPFRFIATCFGAKVDWDNDIGSTIIDYKGKHIVIPIGESFAYVDGVQTPINAPAQIMTFGRTFVPFRAVSELLGGINLDYDPGSMTIIASEGEIDVQKCVAEFNNLIR